MTPEEAEHLQGFPAAQRFGVARLILEQPKPRGAEAQQRRETIAALVRERAGTVPNCRAMVDLLAAKGVQAGYVTISQDYTALGLKTKRTHQREEKVRALGKQTDLPLTI